MLTRSGNAATLAAKLDRVGPMQVRRLVRSQCCGPAFTSICRERGQPAELYRPGGRMILVASCGDEPLRESCARVRSIVAKLQGPHHFGTPHDQSTAAARGPNLKGSESGAKDGQRPRPGRRQSRSRRIASRHGQWRESGDQQGHRIRAGRGERQIPLQRNDPLRLSCGDSAPNLPRLDSRSRRWERHVGKRAACTTIKVRAPPLRAHICQPKPQSHASDIGQVLNEAMLGSSVRVLSDCHDSHCYRRRGFS